MTPERWQQIQALYLAARDPQTGPELLANADPELRRSVEVLLAQDAASATRTIFRAGAQLGPYKIDAPIGAGGMGEVFLATDTRLYRSVAVKILPHDKVADPDRKRRFMQEARAASALNHPNIVTLHDIANDNGVDYLVMEYVPGKSLDKLITPKGLPPTEVIGYATQIASALAAAHAAGIVHRDIKPANVVVTGGGQVKVLDFGLAKLEERAPGPQSETRTQGLTVTEAGVVMGTVAYMSPEQARAEEVDSRTDLFSFGAMLYEMASGHRPFSKPLDWTTPPANALPPELRRIVLKLLQVDRERRYQAAAEVVADLKQLQHAGEGKQTLRLWLAAGAALLAALGFALIAVWYLRPNRPPGRDQWVQLTNFPDSVSQPALSPDGRMLTFVRGPDTFSAPGEIYLKLLPDGEPVQLTRDKLDKMSPVFAPDGSRIAYTVTQGRAWDTWAVPLVSGQPRLWLKNASGLLWLDKQRLLFAEVKNQDIHMGIVTSQETRAEARDVYVPASIRGMAHRTYPSPDGKSALVVEMERGGWLPCRLVPLDGGSAGRPVGPPGARCTFAGWTADGKWMYFSSAAGGTFHVWRQRYPDGQPQQITSGLTEEEGVAIAPDGHSLITSVALRQSVVWLHDASGERQISSEGYSYDPAFTPDGKKLCYRILKGALPSFDPAELRVVELDRGHNEPLLPGLTLSGRPGLAYSISPDGRQVVAAAKDREGKAGLWLAALDRQSPPRRIPNVQGDMPQFGNDGEIFFRTIQGSSAHAYRVHEDGTGLRMLSDQRIVGIYGISQDRRWVVVTLENDRASAKFTGLPVDGGPAIPITAGTRLSWSPDGRLILISRASGPNPSNILGRTYVLPLAPGQVFPTIPEGPVDLRKLPGVRVIEAYDLAHGSAPDVYAFSRQTVQRNLYRIPIP